MKMFLADWRPKEKGREREKQREGEAAENSSALQAGINSLGYICPL